MELLLPGVGLLVREQHQHTRGRLPLSGFRSALTRTLNAYARNKGLLKDKDENLTGDDVREGLTAVISVKLAEPQFEGQTKTKLGNPPVEGLVKETVNRKLGEFLEENPGEARRILQKAVDAARAREARARRATSPGASRHSRTRPCPASSPTAPCATRPLPSSSSSRATPRSSAKQARDRNTQAVLPFAARSSTSRRAGSTRCSRTTRSRR